MYTKVNQGITVVFGKIYAEKNWIIDCSKSKKWASASSKDWLIKDILRVCGNAINNLMGMYLVDVISWREFQLYKARINNKADEMINIIK